MSKLKEVPLRIKSVAEQHQILSLPKPSNPLVSVIRFEETTPVRVQKTVKFTTNFYSIAIKKNCDCKAKYGQTHYDFDEGVMSFMAPDQLVTWHPDDVPAKEGWLLIFHADFVRNYPLGHKIREYGFFGYAVHEALILSEEEEGVVENLVKTIRQECLSRIDAFSQDVIVSQIDLLLTYCNRFYNRQFITRKTVNSDLLSKVETLLADYFNQDKTQRMGLPTVTYLAEKLNMSPKYMSDMLRNLTGQSAQQHIHDKLIDKAKKILATTNLSVGEIAYQLGFEYPQSFSKLFKSKTNVSPLAFRQSFN